MRPTSLTVDGNLDDRINSSSEYSGGEIVPDLDDLIHRQEDEDLPPEMPPETEENFEKAIRGPEHLPRLPRIPPNNAD